LIPDGFICFLCGFRVDPTEKFLARHFVPPIPEDTAATLLEDFGIT
jgi:hypothetical protein